MHNFIFRNQNKTVGVVLGFDVKQQVNVNKYFYTSQMVQLDNNNEQSPTFTIMYLEVKLI